MTTKRNRRLLLKTARRIETIPESYNQNEWAREDSRSPCGTVACLAGEIVICSEPTVKKGVKKLFATTTSMDQDVADLAVELAGLDYEDQFALFYSPRDWPNGIGKGFHGKSRTERAKAAAELLRYLADGGEVQ